MFDEQPKNDTVPPSNLPVEPSDMFDGVEPAAEPAPASPKPPDALSTGLLKRKESDVIPVSSMPTEGLAAGLPPTSTMSQPVLGKIILGAVVLVLLGLSGAGGWWLYARSKNVVAPRAVTPVVVPPVQEAAKVEPIVQVPSSSQPAKNKTDAVLFGAASVADTDLDGLSDQEEALAGTDAGKPDTDGDSLSDGDEVKIWHTNPLKKDTDGDSYPDATEIAGGYSPVGAGKLLNPPVTSVRFVTSTPAGSWQYVAYPIKGLTVTSPTTTK